MDTHTRPQLTDEQIVALGDELDELRGRLIMDVGERDADYIRRIIKIQRALEISGRGLLFAGFLPRPGSAGPPPWPCPRSSTTWRSATTSCTASTTG